MQSLRETCPLPEGWSALEVVEDIIVADGVELRRAGVASIAPDGEELTGSAAEPATSPGPRSYFELLERAATHEALRDRRPTYDLRTAAGEDLGVCEEKALFPESEAPQRWRYARSNGVAIHVDWENATRRAKWELAERDRLLRCWYGELRPERLPFDVASSPLALSSSYDWCVCSFPETDALRFSRDVNVVGVFGFPERSDLPLVLGYGARDRLPDAVDAAVREATQLLAFLWGEPVAHAAPELAPSPMFHLEHFQYGAHHRLLRDWLDGSHMRYGARREVTSATEVAFVDLTPQWLGNKYRVAKAFCRGVTALAFGDPPFAAHLPLELRPHPIA